MTGFNCISYKYVIIITRFNEEIATIPKELFHLA